MKPHQDLCFYGKIKMTFGTSVFMLMFLLSWVSGSAQIDCPELGGNINDFCNDGNAETDYDYINDNCECVGISTYSCEFMEYYLADHDPSTGISDIYEVILEGGVATMIYLSSSDIEVHIAFDKNQHRIYAVSKYENSYRYLDVLTGIWSSTILLGADYGEITSAAFAPNGKLLIGSQDQNALYSLNVMTNVVSSYDTYSPITGGDLAFTDDGMLYMASRSGNGLYEVWPANVMADVLLGSLPPKVTGLAATFSNQLVVSAQGMTSLHVYNTDGSSATSTYALELNGVPYTLRDGDLASACIGSLIIDDCQSAATFYVNHGPNIEGSDLYSVDFTEGNAELSYVTNVDFEAHIAYNSLDNLMYFVNKDGSIIRTYNLSSGSFVGDLPIQGGISQLTAVEYNSADNLLYVGDAGADVIAQIDLSSGIASYYANAPVYGGDLSFLNGDLYLASRSMSELYQIVPYGDALFVGSIPDGVNGMSPSPNGENLITSSAAQAGFVEISAADGTTISTWPTMLDGEPFTFINGDMASGCIEGFEDPTPPSNSFQSELQSELTAYPNPTSGLSQVVFIMAETGRTVVDIYDIGGRKVATLFNETAEAGRTYRLNFDGHYLPNGVYVYKLTTVDETIIEKFMIAR